MHPAPSLVLFTTLSGAGLGLAFWIGVGALADSRAGLLAASLAAALLASGGLAASLFHLRRPARARFALSQWRSSWLSREGILAPTAVALLILNALWHWSAGAAPPPLGWLVAAVSLAAVHATGMIYAQLRAVPAWHGWLTPAVFLAFAVAGGAFPAMAAAAASGRTPDALLLAAIPLHVAAWGIQIRYWRRAAGVGVGASTTASATGIPGNGDVRLLEPPHTGPNYLLKEMAFTVARRHAGRLRSLSLAFGASAVAVALVWELGGRPEILAAPLLALASALHLVGVAAARWLFYAEARHVVTLYYGR